MSFARGKLVAIITLAGTASLQACGGSPVGPAYVHQLPATALASQRPQATEAHPVVSPNYGAATQMAGWMSAEAKTENLLYVSNSYTVSVYSYPRGKLVGTLKHFFRPLGECADAAGDVYIADGSLYEYAHGGTKRIKTLSMYGYAPGSCAVDPTSGDLAVSWDDNFVKGYVAVYHHAKGKPTLYSNGSMLFAFCGYDPSGNLFIDGQYGERSSDFAFAELPKGGSGLTAITLNQSFQHAGAVQWDGEYIAVGDDVVQKIYRFMIVGGSGTLEGTTDLESNSYGYQWSIDGGRVVATNIYFTKSGSHSQVLYYGYPQGGNATKVITRGVGAPFGVTISRAGGR
jgi:hypothetical protein